MLKNTDHSYGWLAKTFHWTIGLLVIVMLIVGNIMTGMENTPAKFQIYSLHKSVGILILMLAIMRLCWRIVNVEPSHGHLARWQRFASHAVHYALYACLFLMPLSGWAMTSASGRTLHFFGLFELPAMVSPDPELAKILAERHAFIGWTIVALLCAHVGAALLHHFYYKDNILKRMLPGRG